MVGVCVPHTQLRFLYWVFFDLFALRASDVRFLPALGDPLAAPQHGAFVNNCHRHHNIDCPAAFATKIEGTSLMQASARRSASAYLPPSRRTVTARSQDRGR